ncbi:hypothetical protein BYT27DRAFT_7215876 [Phlegmacium glaucopus]|nr:hypothetical protein BYT27DRAFT_7215876 [Phlegmacium glaucopus]
MCKFNFPASLNFVSHHLHHHITVTTPGTPNNSGYPLFSNAQQPKISTKSSLSYNQMMRANNNNRGPNDVNDSVVWVPGYHFLTTTQQGPMPAADNGNDNRAQMMPLFTSLGLGSNADISSRYCFVILPPRLSPYSQLVS